MYNMIMLFKRKNLQDSKIQCMQSIKTIAGSAALRVPSNCHYCCPYCFLLLIATPLGKTV